MAQREKSQWTEIPGAGIAYTAHGRIKITDKVLYARLERHFYGVLVERLLGCCKKSGPQGGLGQPGTGGENEFNGSSCGPNEP
jgi:hypothetical protein